MKLLDYALLTALTEGDYCTAAADLAQHFALPQHTIDYVLQRMATDKSFIIVRRVAGSYAILLQVNRQRYFWLQDLGFRSDKHTISEAGDRLYIDLPRTVQP